MDQDWAGGLPKHILDSIVEKLESSIDFLRFGVVCDSWYSITKDNRIKRSKMLRHHQVPMLLVPSEEEHTWSIYNVLDEKFLTLKLSLTYDKHLSCSCQGWLVITNKDYTVTLCRPCFTLEGDFNDASKSIHLPCLFPPLSEFYQNAEDLPCLDNESYVDEIEELLVEGYDFHVLKALITADPLLNPNDCIIFVKYDQCKLAFLRYGKDTTWTKFADAHKFQDVVLYKNHIYAIDSFGRLLSFDPYNGIMKWVASGIQTASGGTLNRYLVESFGELLTIERYVRFLECDGHFYGRVTVMFKVFKLDFAGAKWVEIKSLGDVALFIGDSSGISVLASKFRGCQANCIYFTHDDAELATSCDLGVYFLESQSFNFHYNLDSNVFHRMQRRPPIWIVPLLDGY